MSTRKSLPYEDSTSGDKALTELQRALEKFGCQSFGTMIDNERQAVIVAFKWRDRSIQLEASWKGYAAAWLKVHPYKYHYTKTKQQHDQRALEQGRQSVCSILRDWVKGQTMAIECGIMGFDAVFMPYMLLPTGERVIDKVEKMELLGAPPESNVKQLGRL